MSAYKKFAKNAGIVGISEIAMKLKPILFLPVITNALGPSDYGVYVTLLATTTFIVAFSTLGINNGLVRFLAAERDKKTISTGYSSSAFVAFILSCAVAAVISLSAGFLANTVFGAPNRASVIQVGAWYLPLEALFGLATAFFLVRQRMLLLSGVRLLDTFVPVSFAVILLLNGHGLYAVVLSMVAVRAALVAAEILIIIRLVGISMPHLGVAWSYMRFGLPLVMAMISYAFLNVGDRYIIGLFLGATSVGIYTVSYTLGSALSIIMAPLTTALLAPLTKSHDEGRPREVSTYLSYSLRYYLMFAIPATVGVSVLSSPIIASLATQEFLVGSYGITALVAFSTLFYCLFSIYSNIFFLLKRTRNFVILMVVAAAVNLSLDVLLIPRIGIIGPAFATLAAFSMLFAGAFLMTRKHIKVDIDLRFLAKCVLASLAIGLLAYFLRPTGWIKVALSVALCVAVYFALLFSMRAFRPHEVRFFKSFLRLQGTAVD
jgi:O-antigen/teichoic acid export membrane protein